MTDTHKTTTQDKDGMVGSAPELPHEVAKQYGLHREAHSQTENTKSGMPEAVAKGGQKQADEPSWSRAGSEPAPASSEVTLDDSKTEAAVDDILTKESDQLLGISDDKVPDVATPSPRLGFWRRIGHFFVRWWRNTWARWITIVVVAGLLTAAAVWPTSRYAILNTAGVRSSASVVILDDATQLPLKNVTVTMGKMASKTNKDGKASFKDLRLGAYPLTVKRIAFAQYHANVTIGWGSNPLGPYKIKATGTQYTIMVIDYLSGKGIKGAEAMSDEANALADKNGKIILTVDDTNVTTLSATVMAEGYRSHHVTIDANTSPTASVVLVPAARSVYVSKQSGKYDVYASDLDGQDKKLLLAGTGNENSNISLVVSPDGQRAALVSTRDSLKDDDGYLLQALTIIDLSRGTSVTVDHAEQLQLVDWIGDRLIYRMTLAGASASNPQRNRLISYNYDSNARLQLATANQFNAVVSSHGYIYYTVSGTDPQAALGLFRIKVDGSARKQLSQDEIWTVVRTGYDSLALQLPDGWRSYDMAADKLDTISQPASLTSRIYVNDAKNTRSLWMDIRDGQGTLLLHDIAKNTDKTLQVRSGISAPLRWASDKAIIYRVAVNGETAEYAASPDGGEAHKVADVTATYGYAPIY